MLRYALSTLSIITVAALCSCGDSASSAKEQLREATQQAKEQAKELQQQAAEEFRKFEKQTKLAAQEYVDGLKVKAAGGDAYAELQLAVLEGDFIMVKELTGRIVEEDKQAAIEWFQQAKAQGFEAADEALRELGVSE